MRSRVRGPALRIALRALEIEGPEQARGLQREPLLVRGARLGRLGHRGERPIIVLLVVRREVDGGQVECDDQVARWAEAKAAGAMSQLERARQIAIAFG